MAQMREDLYEELAPDDPEPLVHDDDLERLQLRLVGLFEAELISEEEYLTLEDLTADFAELQSTAPDGIVTKECASSVAKAALRWWPGCLSVGLTLLRYMTPCLCLQISRATRLLGTCRSLWVLSPSPRRMTCVRGS